jgi:hypothetical protein
MCFRKLNGILYWNLKDKRNNLWQDKDLSLGFCFFWCHCLEGVDVTLMRRMPMV